MANPNIEPAQNCEIGSMNSSTLFARYWQYQAERFPLVSYAVLVGALVAGSFGLAAMTMGPEIGSPAPPLVAWLTTLGIFFQMRVADEFKDFAADSRFRPYRPVPRGLVSLDGLARLGLGLGLGQLILNVSLDPWLLLPLGLVWGYLWLMRHEFFVHQWLLARPVLYMLSHMVIMVWLFVYILAVAVWPVGGGLPQGTGWFLWAGFVAGIVFEVGRKIRAPEDEETGVETYSALWGVRKAASVWWLALTLAALGLAMAAWPANRGWEVAALVFGLLLPAVWIALRYVRLPSRSRAKWIDTYSALWVLGAYLGLAFFSWWQ